MRCQLFLAKTATAFAAPWKAGSEASAFFLPDAHVTLSKTLSCRSFDARPVYSADEAGGTRFKMERFLHPGRANIASVYAPIAFGPLPLLAFQRRPDGSLRLAASGNILSPVFSLAPLRPQLYP